MYHHIGKLIEIAKVAYGQVEIQITGGGSAIVRFRPALYDTVFNAVEGVESVDHAAERLIEKMMGSRFATPSILNVLLHYEDNKEEELSNQDIMRLNAINGQHQDYCQKCGRPLDVADYDDGECPAEWGTNDKYPICRECDIVLSNLFHAMFGDKEIASFTPESELWNHTVDVFFMAGSNYRPIKDF